MSLQDAESANFGGKRLPCWPEIPVAGIRLRDLSLPPFARCVEAGWKPSSPAPLWTVPLFNKAQIIDSFSSDMEMQTWKAAARHSSIFRFGERYHHRFRQESQISVDQRRQISRLHGRWDLLVLWSNP